MLDGYKTNLELPNWKFPELKFKVNFVTKIEFVVIKQVQKFEK